MKASRILLPALLCALLPAASAQAGVRLVTREVPLPPASARALLGVDRVLPARPAPARFNLVGLHWRGAGSVSFRTAPVGGRWSPWRGAQLEAEDRPDPGSAELRRTAGWRLGNPYWTGTARRIQYRLSGRVARLRAHFLWSPVTSAPAARRVAGVPAQPAIVTRAGWGADESLVRGSPSYADRLAFAVVHHTAGTKPSSPAQSAAVVRGVFNYHVRSNGWNDVGYNFLVDPFGQIFEGRAGGITRDVIGAHAQGFNTGSVGVAVLGTYTDAPISRAARDALAGLLAWRLDLAHVDPLSRLARVSGGSPKYAAGTTVTLNAVNGHRDTGSTTCPGSALYGELAGIAGAAATEGGPKLFDPRATGSLGGAIRFTARVSEPRAWTVTVRDALGTAVATGFGTGTAVDWTWQSAGAPAGRYTYTIAAGADVRPVDAGIGGAVPLAITRLAARPATFSPNGDGVAEVADVEVTLSTAAQLVAWVEDGRRTRVTTLSSGRPVGAGTTRLRWKGGARGGDPAPDGRYRIVVEARAGVEEARKAVGVTLDRTLGRLRVTPSPFSPNGDGRRETVALAFELAREASVRVRIFRGTRPLLTLASGRRAAGRQALAWDGRAGGRRVGDGALRAVVEATTIYGRRVLARTFTLDTRPPRVSGLAARRSGRGTVVRFLVNEPSRLVVQLGSVRATTRRGAGVVSFWRRARPGRVSVQARDGAGNVARPVSVRVRRR